MMEDLIGFSGLLVLFVLYFGLLYAITRESKIHPMLKNQKLKKTKKKRLNK